MFDISNISRESLASLETEQLIHLTLTLNEENEKLKKSTDESTLKKYDERLERLERELNLNKQYQRRDTIEISGVPQNIPDDCVEDEVIKILKAAKAKIGNRYPGSLDIHAAHRKKIKTTLLSDLLIASMQYPRCKIVEI